MDNVGKINADTTKNYYIKDHLGSTRVVLNSTNTVISAQDYDAWGHVLENRVYNPSVMKYDFTGKERDDETSYDYFGARYYDSRIGRWGGVEPLLDKYVNLSPYSYSFNNPIRYIDIDGESPWEKLIEVVVKQVLKQVVKKGTDRKGKGWGNEGEDRDHDGEDDGTDSFDGRTAEQKNLDEQIKKMDWNKITEDIKNAPGEDWDIEKKIRDQEAKENEEIEKKEKQIEDKGKKRIESKKKDIKPYDGKGKLGDIPNPNL